jgi:hypothetical protein
MIPSTDPLGQQVNVNFRMTERERRAFKAWCAENGLSLTEGFREGAALLRGARDLLGSERADAILQLVGSATAFLIDPDRDLSVERRGADAWAVRQGGSVVNRDGEREPEPMPSSRDEAFIARTRFTLPEALRVARGRAERSG